MAQLLLQRPLLRPLPAIGASSAPAHAARCTRRRWTCTLCAAETAGSPAVVQAAVGVMTGLLRLGRGSSRQEPAAPRRLDGARDVDALMALLRDDFEQHAYFVTGDICEGIYASNCYFADPTVSFSGLQLLVPFLEEPRIELLALAAGPAPRELRAEWRLVTRLRLPWRPLVDILGATAYTLDASSLQIESHVESWDVSGGQALAMLFRPGPPPDMER